MTDALRLPIVPGLRDSGPAHWQTWLQARHRGALRVQQADWSEAGWPQGPRPMLLLHGCTPVRRVRFLP